MSDETNPNQPQALDALRELGRLQEEPVRSTVPVLGGVIAAVRQALYSISVKWYVRPMIAQQTAFNEGVVDSFDTLRAAVDQSRAGFAALEGELDRRLLSYDQDHVQLTHDLGELSVHLAQLNRAIEAIESRLDELDGIPSADAANE